MTARHGPAELNAEISRAGLADVEVVGVEGPVGTWARRAPALNAAEFQLAELSVYGSLPVN